MHEAPPPRKTVAASTATGFGYPFAAVVAANVALAFGPWFVRLADTGPVAAGFWRITLAIPFLGALAFASGARPVRLDKALWWVLGAGGIAFAADLGSWHLGILRTTLANATLFGNSAILIFPLYGFLVARAWPTRTQGLALGLAALGAALLMGRSYQLDPRHLAGDLLCVLAGILYTVYFIAMVRARGSMAPLPALVLSTIASSLPLLAFALVLGERIVPGNWAAADRAGAGQPGARPGPDDLCARQADAAGGRHRAADPADRRRYDRLDGLWRAAGRTRLRRRRVGGVSVGAGPPRRRCARGQGGAGRLT